MKKKRLIAKKKTSHYEVDQSGKVEQTNKITIVPFSNDKNSSISLSSSDKRNLESIYRQAGKGKIFPIQVFTALVYLLIEKYSLEDRIIVIDTEYPGHANLIRSYVVQLANKLKKIELLAENLRFEQVGKSSNAHLTAYSSFKKKRGDKKASAKDILACVLLYEK